MEKQCSARSYVRLARSLAASGIPCIRYDPTGCDDSTGVTSDIRLSGLVDEALRAAYSRGAVLGGVSAGSICWHVGGPTDSFGPQLQAVRDGLALVPFGNGVHYDSEEQRRPLLQSLVADGTLPTSYATDDRAAVIYRGTEPVEVVLDKPGLTARAYRVEAEGGRVCEGGGISDAWHRQAGFAEGEGNRGTSFTCLNANS